jgi:hypothetical protein
MLAWPVLALMAAWTVLTTYAYADPARRRPPLIVLDLLITMAAMASSTWIVGSAQLAANLPTLAVAWHGAPVLVCSVAGGRRAGIAAAVIIGGTDLIVRARNDQAGLTGSVLLLLAASGRSSSRRPPGSVSGWPATSTTRCCRSWPW